MIQTTPVLPQNKAFWKKSWFWIVLLLVVAIVLVAVYKGREEKNGSKVNEVSKNLPSYFVPQNTELSSSVPADPVQYKLAENEAVQEGIRYTVDKPKAEVVKDYLAVMAENKWYPTTGTVQDENKTVIKLGNKTQILIAHIEKISDSKTQVSIYPVTR